VGAIDDSLIAELRDIRFALASAGGRQIAVQHVPMVRAMEGVEKSLRKPLRLGVLGEGNSGKSLLINYLLRHQILPSGGFAGETTQILIRYAPEPSVSSIGPDGSRNRLTSKAFGRLVKPESRPLSVPAVIYDAASGTGTGSRPTSMIFTGPPRQGTVSRLIEVGLPIDLLKTVEIVEVRGFPEAKANGPVRRAFRDIGLIVWCTLATQAWKETEVTAWSRVPRLHRKAAVMLITYKDAVRQAKDQVKIMARMRQATASLFDDVALISLRDAVQSLVSMDSEEAERLRADSNVEAAESALAAVIRGRQLRRLEKASGILGRIARRLGASAAALNATSMRELAIRLERLAAALRHASPSIVPAVEPA
jgi:GTPase SAR1 family protein